MEQHKHRKIRVEEDMVHVFYVRTMNHALFVHCFVKRKYSGCELWVWCTATYAFQAVPPPRNLSPHHPRQSSSGASCCNSNVQRFHSPSVICKQWHPSLELVMLLLEILQNIHRQYVYRPIYRQVAVHFAHNEYKREVHSFIYTYITM